MPHFVRIWWIQESQVDPASAFLFSRELNHLAPDSKGNGLHSSSQSSGEAERDVCVTG